MDKQFWISIKENNFAVPEGYSLLLLTEDLITFIASTDPDLRDTIGLEAFYNWLSRGMYTSDDLRGFNIRLVANLEADIGEIDGDSVFLRSFSALWLANIIAYDNRTNSLDYEDIQSVLAAALAYFATEQDLRGNVPGKGYAHAIAHAADLLSALATSQHTSAEHHWEILQCIASKLRTTGQGILSYNEDSRIAQTAKRVFMRNTIKLGQIEEWLENLSGDWIGAWVSEERTRAYNNGRNFVRALHWYIRTRAEDYIHHKEAILQLLHNTLESARPWDDKG